MEDPRRDFISHFNYTSREILGRGNYRRYRYEGWILLSITSGLDLDGGRRNPRRRVERTDRCVVWTLKGFCCQAEDKFKSSTGHCRSLSPVNLEIGKLFSLNSQENLQLRILPEVSSRRGQTGAELLCGGVVWCLYQCFVCEFVVSFDRIIPHPREEGELLLSTVKVQPRSPGTASSSSSCPRHVVEVKGGEVCGSPLSVNITTTR